MFSIALVQASDRIRRARSRIRRSASAASSMMNYLKLPNPKMMDVAVSSQHARRTGAGRGCPARMGHPTGRGHHDRAAQHRLRRDSRFHPCPYLNLQENISSGGLLNVVSGTRELVFYCAFGERSAMAVQAAQSAGIEGMRHIHGGMAAWKAVGAPLFNRDAAVRAGAYRDGACGAWINPALAMWPQGNPGPPCCGSNSTSCCGRGGCANRAVGLDPLTDDELERVQEEFTRLCESTLPW
jgi:rhodanese-related sulfurtransferase